MSEALQIQVGWKAYRVHFGKQPEVIAMGRDVFMAITWESACRQATKKVPKWIGEPEAQIAFRYVRRYDRDKGEYVKMDSLLGGQRR